jgi:hypothetical protein
VHLQNEGYRAGTVSAPGEGEKLPPFDPDTVIGSSPTFHVRHQDAMAWANREAFGTRTPWRFDAAMGIYQ